MKSLVIFDWDDTLFPTSHLYINNDYSTLSHIDDLLFDIFIKIISTNTQIYIVTNASAAWFRHSVTYLPLFSALLDKIILYAADDYMNFAVVNRKILMFNDIFTEFTDEDINIIVIGDAEYEFIALDFILTLYPNHIHKGFKFKELPCFDDIIFELCFINEIIYNCINDHTHTYILDVIE